MSTLTMIRGDTRIVTTTISNLDANNNVVLGSSGVTGWQFWMTAKYDPNDADSAAVFQILPAAFTVPTAGNASTPAVIQCSLPPSATANLPGHQVALVYDVQGVDTSGNVFTVDSGTLTVVADVTVTT
jgi:hypothetical protein